MGGGLVRVGSFDGVWTGRSVKGYVSCDFGRVLGGDRGDGHIVRQVRGKREGEGERETKKRETQKIG